MNCEAMAIPRERLRAALQERIDRKAEVLAARDAALGADRVRIQGYMENIGWPDLFGYDMNDVFRSADLAFEMHLRQRIFWADNSLDDSPVGPWMGADVGMYWDMTLFGASIWHTRDGVPQFDPHPLAQDPSPERVPAWSFETSGVMPALIANYHRLREISEQEHEGFFPIGFPSFHRGPVDILLQLRGYEGFVWDTRERPEAVHELLGIFADARPRFARERAAFLGEEPPASTFVADDWVNIPFLSPAMFREFVLPVYRRIRASEGPVTGFHTCGRMEAIIADLLDVFPDMGGLDVSGWNDLDLLHRLVPREKSFHVSLINTFVLAAPREQHLAKLQRIAAISKERRVSLGVQAIVNLCGTYEETLARMNAFIELARETLK